MAYPAGTWGLYQWFREHGEQLIHPDDLGAFERLQPNSKVFLCEGEQAEYLVLLYDQEHYRVKPDLFKPVAPPKRVFRERVWVSKDKKPTEAKVSDIIWHFQRQEPYYLLEIEGKKGKKQYWPDDLQPSRETEAPGPPSL